MRTMIVMFAVFIFLGLVALDAPVLATGNELKAKKVDKGPVIDGKPDKIWNKMRSFKIKLTEGEHPKEVTASVKALYTDTDLYLLIRWKDPTESYNRVYEFDGTQWIKRKSNEDRLGMMWDINDNIKDFKTKGCAILCHEEGKYMKTNAPSERGDVWHWKAQTSNPVGYADDQMLTDIKAEKGDREETAAEKGHHEETEAEKGHHEEPAAEKDHHEETAAENGHHEETVAEKGHHEETGKINDEEEHHHEGTGRINDKKEGGSYSANWDEAAKRPKYTFKDNSKSGPILTKAEAVVITKDTIFTKGFILPQEVLAKPVGSRGDIEAKGIWRKGTWTLEIKRALKTGHDDDVQFDPSKVYYFGMSIFDNTHDKEHATTTVTANKLIFN